jgi:hypothetical protein
MEAINNENAKEYRLAKMENLFYKRLLNKFYYKTNAVILLFKTNILQNISKIVAT